MKIDPNDLTCEYKPGKLLFPFRYSVLQSLIGSVVGAGIWFNIETNLGIVCACLPTLGPLCQYYRFSNSSSGSKPIRPLFVEKHDSGLSAGMRLRSTGDGEDGISGETDKGNVTYYSAALTSVTSEDQEADSILARKVALHT